MPDFSLPRTATALPHGGLRTLLPQIGAPDQFGNPATGHTGRLVIENPADKGMGALYFRAGRIYAATLKGFTPPVATRMLSGDLITQETFEYLDSLDPETVGPEAIERDG